MNGRPNFTMWDGVNIETNNISISYCPPHTENLGCSMAGPAKIRSGEGEKTKISALDYDYILEYNRTSFMKTQDRIKKILSLLDKAYGKRPTFERTDPVDELIRTILSQNTTDKNSLAAFAILKIRFKPWGKLLRAESRKIAGLIRHAGLANIKAKRIKGVLAEIKRREGRISLASLKGSSIEDSLEYLKSLKGVGPKTAACILLFGLGRPVMPVDTHIFRVTKRLGLIGKNMDIKKAHEELTDMVPKHLIYDFHLGIIEHGRKTCKALNPRCGICVLYKFCRFEKKVFFKKRGAN